MCVTLPSPLRSDLSGTFNLFSLQLLLFKYSSAKPRTQPSLAYVSSDNFLGRDFPLIFLEALT